MMHHYLKSSGSLHQVHCILIFPFHLCHCHAVTAFVIATAERKATESNSRKKEKKCRKKFHKCSNAVWKYMNAAMFLAQVATIFINMWKYSCVPLLSYFLLILFCNSIFVTFFDHPDKYWMNVLAAIV